MLWRWPFWMLVWRIFVESLWSVAFTLRPEAPPFVFAPLLSDERALRDRQRNSGRRRQSALAAKAPWFVKAFDDKKKKDGKSKEEEEEMLEPLVPHSPEEPVLRLSSQSEEASADQLKDADCQLTQDQRDEYLWAKLHAYDLEKEGPDANSYFSRSNIQKYHKYNPDWNPLIGRAGIIANFFLETDGVTAAQWMKHESCEYGYSPPRPPREIDMANPSVPFGWRVYTALCLHKSTQLCNRVTSAKDDCMLHAVLGHQRMHLQHLAWSRLSTRDPDASAKVIALFSLLSLQLEPHTDNSYPDRNPAKAHEIPQEEIDSGRLDKRPPTRSFLGDCIFFAAPSLHRAQQFLLSNPKSKAGLYGQQHLFESIDVTAEHILLGKGNRRNAERDKLFLSVGLFKMLPPSKLPPQNDPQKGSDNASTVPRIRRDDFADLEEYHLRFLCRSNCVNMRKFLFSPRTDSVEELLLPPQQLLPMTENQKSRCLHRFALRRKKARVAAASASDLLARMFEEAENQSVLKALRRGSDKQTNLENVVSTQIKVVLEALRKAVPKAAWEADDLQIAASAVSLASYQTAVKFEKDPDVSSTASCIASQASRLASKYPSLSSVQAATLVADREGPWAAMADGKDDSALPLAELFEEARKASAVEAFSSTASSCSNVNKHAPHVLGEGKAPREVGSADGSAENLSALTSNPNSPSKSALLARRAIGEALFVWCEDATEMKEFIERTPFLREGAYASVFAAEAVALDFYGKAERAVIPVQPRLEHDLEKLGSLDKSTLPLTAAFEAEVAKCKFQETDEDQVEWILKSKEMEEKNASVDLDKPFYDDYLRDWAYIHLPEGEYISEPFHVSADMDRGSMHEPSTVTAEELNRDPRYTRLYLPGIWLYKPEAKILYQDKQSGAILIGSGLDGTFSWDKPVDKATMQRAKILMEMALENIRKGGGWYDTEMGSPYSRSKGKLQFHLSPEEFAERKFTLEPFVNNELGPEDNAPSGMEYLQPELLAGRPVEYQRLLRHPDIVHEIQRRFIEGLKRGERTIRDDPFRLDATELDPSGKGLDYVEWEPTVISSEWDENGT